MFTDPAENASRYLRAESSRDRLRDEFDNPFTTWSSQLSDVSSGALALPESDRIAIAAPLVTFERNLDVVTGGSPERITQMDICLSLLVFRAMFGYWGFITGLAPPTGWGDLAVGHTLGLGIDSADAALENAGCAEVLRPGGAYRHECDVLVRYEDDMDADGVPNRMSGNVYGSGSMAGADLGFDGDGADIEVPVLLPLAGAFIRVLDAVTMSPIGVGGNSLTDGIFQLSTLPPGTDVILEVSVPGLDEVILVPITTPPDGEIHYQPVFVPLPDMLPLGGLNGFEITRGNSAGLLPDASAYSVRAFDADGDALIDAYFGAGPELAGIDIYAAYLARAVGDGGVFEPVSFGPLMPEDIGYAPSIIWPVDFDMDGANDVLGLNLGGQALSGLTFDTEQMPLGGAFGSLYEFPAGNTACGTASGLAVGDFVEGNGPDVFVISSQSTGGADTIFDPVNGALCTLSNDGTGTLTPATNQARTGPGAIVAGTSEVADLDGDGALDAAFIEHGSIFYGDGAGAFTEVALPSECWITNPGTVSSSAGVRMADFDQDGDLDLFTPYVEWLDSDFMPIDAGPCFIRNDGGRAWSATVMTQMRNALIDAPCDGDCVRTDLADLDHDGVPEIFMYEPNSGVQMFAFEGDDARLIETGALVTDRPTDLEFVDLNGDGWLDVLIGNDDDRPDSVGIRTRTGETSSVAVEVVDAQGAIGWPGAVLEVDLDASGFSDGTFFAIPVQPFPTHIGIGDAATVDVRLRIPRIGGDIVIDSLGVTAGSTAQIVVP